MLTYHPYLSTSRVEYLKESGNLLQDSSSTTHYSCLKKFMNSWKNIKDYTKNDLFFYFKDIPYTKRDFIEKGEELYDLKTITCKLKLRRGIKEGLVMQVENKYLTVKR